MAVAVRKVFLIQGLAVCLVALPLQSLAVVGLGSPTVFWMGVVVAAVGMLVEAVGDIQLSAYKADANRSPVLDRGLWAWTRHPNYFGDAVFWIGIWIAGGPGAHGTWIPAFATIAAPIAMTLFGKHDPILGKADAPLREHVPGTNGQPHDRLAGGHFIQEDVGPEIARRTIDWIRSA